MTRGGRRHGLVIYRVILNRWWPETLGMGLILALIAWKTYQIPLGQNEPWRWQMLAGFAGVTVVAGIVLAAMRGMAYVQVFPQYVKLATPFMRLNISYKRVRRTTTTEMRALFPPGQMRGWKRDVVSPLGGRTAVVLELNGWPADPKMMRVFLSHFFFKDKTPHFVILVDDWMKFSTELESMRSGGGNTQPRGPTREVKQSILSRLPRKDS
ncbi:MAG: hypothetical protein HY867_14680 [Chloroflexi bacterium]|nr:hypothetical protein [Chloroflexota bacterium]